MGCEVDRQVHAGDDMFEQVYNQAKIEAGGMQN